MFVRTKDDVKLLQTENSHISFTKHDEAEKVNRKWNSIRKFRLHDNKIEFFNNELICKMIPKHQVETFQYLDLKMIIADSNILIYQDFNEHLCKFLTLDDAGDIQTLDFFDIQPDVTEIFCYDEATAADYLCTVNFAFLLTSEDDSYHNVVLHQFEEQNKTLSNYIIYTEPREGIIINNIFVI